MRRSGAVALVVSVALALLLTGCGLFRNLRLIAPGCLGM